MLFYYMGNNLKIYFINKFNKSVFHDNNIININKLIPKLIHFLDINILKF